jgi:hypothetical protein
MLYTAISFITRTANSSELDARGTFDRLNSTSSPLDTPKGLVRGYSFLPLLPMRLEEPAVKRAITFTDGQNLFHSARLAFGYTYPNYDVRALTDRLCRIHDWQSTQVWFYTGIRADNDDPRWHHLHRVSPLWREHAASDAVGPDTPKPRRRGARAVLALSGRISRSRGRPPGYGFGLGRRRARRLLLMLCAVTLLENADKLKPLAASWNWVRARNRMYPIPDIGLIRP